MNNNKNQKDRLEAMLKSKADKLSNEVVKSDGEINPSQLEELERIERLIKVIDQPKVSAVKKRWYIVIPLVLTLAIISILLFSRVSSTEIELDISVSEINFRLSQPQALSQLTQVSSLGFSGIEEIIFPAIMNSESRILKAEEGTALNIKLSIDSSDTNQNSLTLPPLILNKASHVWIKPDKKPTEYQLSLRNHGVIFLADVFGTITSEASGFKSEKLIFKIPQSITLNPGKNDADISVYLLPQSKALFSKQLFIDSLSLFFVEEYLNDQYSLSRKLSTVMAGKLYYESLNGLEYKLRTNQEISFKNLSGYIRTLEIKDGRIDLSFHGNVSGIYTGSGDNQLNLMPTCFEWLKARHSLSLLWGTTLYFFGLLLGVMNWWRNTK